MQNKRINWLDGLRALAILPVIIYHINSYYLPGGFIGVDIFFVISGFIISKSAIDNYNSSGNFLFREFFVSRFKRIFPILFFVILVTNLISIFLLYPEVIYDNAEATIFNLLFLSNFHFLNNGSYFNDAAEFQPLIHTWSLSVEEQFYLFFPIIFYFFLKKKNKFFIISFIFISIFSLLASQLSGNLKLSYPFIEENFSFNNQSIFFSYYSSFGRVWEISAGVIIGLSYSKISDQISKINKYILDFFTTIGLSLIFFSFILINKNHIFPGFITIYPVLGVIMCIVFIDHSCITKKIISNNLLSKIGIISFSIYLIHQPLLVFFKIYFSNNLNYFHYFSYFILLILFSVLSNLLIEKKYHQNKNVKLSTVIKFVTVLIFLNILITYLIFENKGFNILKYKTAGINFLNQYQGKQTIKDDYKNECSFIDTSGTVDRSRVEIDQKECIIINDNKINILIWGDSHAMALNYGIRNIFQDFNISQITTNGCEPNLVLINPVTPCEKSNRKAQEIISSGLIDLVIIAQSKGHEKTDWDNLINSLDNKKNTKFFLVGPTPQWIYPGLPKIYAKNILKLSSEFDTNININKKTLNTDFQMSNKKFNKIKYISLISKLCLNEICRFKVDVSDQNSLIVVDQGHLSRDGSLYIAKSILYPFIKNFY